MKKSPTLKEIELGIVGSNRYGRYPKISSEQTWNLIISDGWLVPYAGYEKTDTLSTRGAGRGIYTSTRHNHLYMAIGNTIYSADQNLSINAIAEIETDSGAVFFAENNAGQICICDLVNLYVYNYISNTFQKVIFLPGDDFVPGYIAFQNTYFISVDLKSNKWRLSGNNNGLSWPVGGPNVGEFQTKVNQIQGAVPFPGKGNLLFVFGDTVIEPWQDVGSSLFPYQRSAYYNIDYGVINPETIAVGDKIVAWVAQNEKSGPVIVYSDGSQIIPISNDGIDFKLAALQNPEASIGFLMKQDGHLLYQVTFYDPRDNLSIIYDFNTQSLFNVSDHSQNYHIARKVAFFNNSYYFVSLNDGGLYRFDNQIYTLDGEMCPRIRITPTMRIPDSTRFITNNINFVVEEGNSASLQSADLSISTNGGVTFGSYWRKDFNTVPRRQNILNWFGLGAANEITFQLRFWGYDRFVIGEGLASVYQ